MIDLQELRDVIVSDLKANAKRAACSASGGGCEKWLAGESRIAIIWASSPMLPKMASVEVERRVTKSQRADLVVIRVNKKWKQPEVLAISEFKAVENRADSYVDELLQDLKQQLDGHRHHHPVKVKVFGVVFAVWAPEHAHRTVNPAGIIEPLADFVCRLKGRIASAGMTVAADGEFATIFDKRNTGGKYPNWLRGLAVAIITV